MKAKGLSRRADGKRQGAVERTGTNGRRIRTVILDDSPFVVVSLRLFFEQQEGFEVVGVAETGLEGVQRVAELAPDLVVMDMRMPGMDGLEATRRIKAHQGPPVVIMFTLEDGKEVRTAAKAAGADYLVTKAREAAYTLRTAIRGAFPEVKVRASKAGGVVWRGSGQPLSAASL